MENYFTKNFHPITHIPHKLIKDQLSNPLYYQFPILQNFSSKDYNQIPLVIKQLFLKEAKQSSIQIDQLLINQKEKGQRQKILLHKIVHTDYTMTTGIMLYRKLPNQISPVQSIILALLHDIGRFPELYLEPYKYIPHAELSVHIIKREWRNNSKFRVFIKKHFEKETLLTAIGEHSKAYYQGGNLFAHFLRDIDKISIIGEIKAQILRSNNNNFTKEEISPKVARNFTEKKLVFKNNQKTIPDKILSNIGFIPQMHFEESKDLVNKLNLNELLWNQLNKYTLTLNNSLKESVKRKLRITIY